MGCWGMGINECDEFLEVYDQFMEEYDNGKPCSEITTSILSKYHAEFDDEDGVMHDVYFALAKAEWMCCEQSDLVLNRVKEIVESGANIEFFRELEACESDLKKRKKNLDKFLSSLLVPREKPRKRKRSTPAIEKVFPPMEVGECFAYKYGNGYRVFCVIERFATEKGNERVTVAILNREFDKSTLKSSDFKKEEIGAVFTLTPKDFISASAIKSVGSVEVKKHNKMRLLGNYMFLPGDKQYFRREFLRTMQMSLGEFLYHCEENSQDTLSSIEIGGCYAYKVSGEYRFAAFLDKPQFQGENWFLVAIFSPDTQKADFTSLTLASLKVYDESSLPNLVDWKRVGSIDVPKGLHQRLFGNTRYLGTGILEFIDKKATLINKKFDADNIEQLLCHCKKNAPDAIFGLKAGECYSFLLGDGYRFAIVLDRFALYGDEQALVAVLAEKHRSPDEDYMDDTIAHFGIYSVDTLPNVDRWVKKGDVLLSDDVKAYSARFRTTTTECVMKFLSSPSYSSGYLTLRRLLEMKLPTL